MRNNIFRHIYGQQLASFGHGATNTCFHAVRLWTTFGQGFLAADGRDEAHEGGRLRTGLAQRDLAAWSLAHIRKKPAKLRKELAGGGVRNG